MLLKYKYLKYLHVKYPVKLQVQPKLELDAQLV